MNILYKDKFIIVAEKPPNMPVQDDKTGDLSALSIVSSIVSAEQDKPYTAAINRLDRGVGGLVLFALDQKSAAFLSSCHEAGFNKQYSAVVCGKPETQTAKAVYLTDFLSKNERTNLSKVVPPKTSGAKKAHLHYEFLHSVKTEAFSDLSLLRVTLETGRHHQIRVQLSNARLPLWGDTKYNKSFDKGGKLYKAALNAGIDIAPALWASSLAFTHPDSGRAVSFTSAPKGYPFQLFPPEEQSC